MIPVGRLRPPTADPARLERAASLANIGSALTA